MWSWMSRLRPGWVRISTDKPVYRPGEEVVVKVQTRGRGTAEMGSAIIQLVRTEKVPGKEAAGDEINSGVDGCAATVVVVFVLLVWAVILKIVSLVNRSARQEREDAFVTVVRQESLSGAPSAGGEDTARVVRFVLPDPVPPTGRGRDFEVTWSVRVRGPRATRPDRIATTRFVVLAKRDTYARLGGRPSLGARSPATSADCELDLAVATTEVMPGQRVAGRLAVLAREPFKYSAVKISLIRWTKTPKDRDAMPSFRQSTRIAFIQRTTDSPKGVVGGGRDLEVFNRLVSSGGRFEAGVWREFPFEFMVSPGACPSMRTVDLTVAWCLRATVVRRMRTDERATVPLTVYNAPEDSDSPLDPDPHDAPAEREVTP